MYRFREEHPFPSGSELAWSTYRRLSNAAVSRYGLQLPAWQSLGEAATAELFDLVVAIAEGVLIAEEELRGANG